MAGKLKDITCLLLGCTREQLEDREFKEKELGEEWSYWESFDGSKMMIPLTNRKSRPGHDWILTKMTPRKLMQLLGTECGRDILHPNIWCVSLFADYKPAIKQRWFEPTENLQDTYTGVCQIEECDKKWHSSNKRNAYCKEHNEAQPDVFPKWIITDVRFPNEAKAVKDRGGIMIRVNRNFVDNDMLKDEHPSETGLDDYGDFDHIIENDGSIEDLINKVRALNIV